VELLGPDTARGRDVIGAWRYPGFRRAFRVITAAWGVGYLVEVSLYTRAVRRTLIVTNDFPPRQGGIQSFVYAMATRLPPGTVIVYAPAWTGAAEFDAEQPFPVIRHPTSLMLPLPPRCAGSA